MHTQINSQKKIGFVVAEVGKQGSNGKKNWALDEGGQKVQSSRYKINKYQEYKQDMINIINTAVCYK